MESARKLSTTANGSEEVKSPQPAADYNSPENVEKRKVKRAK